MLEPLGINIIGAGKPPYLVSRGIGAIVRMQSLADRFGIQNSSDLEPAKLETVNRRLQFAL